MVFLGTEGELVFPEILRLPYIVRFILLLNYFTEALSWWLTALYARNVARYVLLVKSHQERNSCALLDLNAVFFQSNTNSAMWEALSISLFKMTSPRKDKEITALPGSDKRSAFKMKGLINHTCGIMVRTHARQHRVYVLTNGQTDHIRDYVAGRNMHGRFLFWYSGFETMFTSVQK